MIARRGPVVVFVEVKTRRSRALGPPELAVDAHKRARLIRGAVAWLSAQPRATAQVRFDVIACEARPGGDFRIRHIEDAFDAGP